ncbi:MAG: TIR domain-containing protein [Chloroflexota bacterium]
MDRQCFNDIIMLLTPYMTTTSVRQDILTAAWYGTPLEYAIQWEGNPRTFTSLAVRKADTFGYIDKDLPALRALLESLRPQVGYDVQEKIDEIIIRCFEPPKPKTRPQLPSASNTPAKNHIFISYSSADRATFVDRVAKNLQEKGHTIWVDNLGPKYYGITAGKAWKQQLADALNQAKSVVFVITPDSLQSGWCQAELTRAHEQSTPIIPVLARPLDVDARQLMSTIQLGDETLADKQYRDFTTLGYDRGFETLLDDIDKNTE